MRGGFFYAILFVDSFSGVRMCFSGANNLFWGLKDLGEFSDNVAGVIKNLPEFSGVEEEAVLEKSFFVKGLLFNHIGSG